MEKSLLSLTVALIASLTLLPATPVAAATGYTRAWVQCFDVFVETPAERAAHEAEAARQELREPKPDGFGDSITVRAHGSEEDPCLGGPPVSRIVLLSTDRRLESKVTLSIPLEFFNKMGARFTVYSAVAAFEAAAFQALVQDGPFEVAIVRTGRDLLKAAIQPLTSDAARLAARLLESAIELLNAGRSEEATAAFQKAEAADPANAEVNFHLGTLAVGHNKIPEAIARLEKYLSMSPKNAQNVATAQGLLAALKPKK